MLTELTPLKISQTNIIYVGPMVFGFIVTEVAEELEEVDGIIAFVVVVVVVFVVVENNIFFVVKVRRCKGQNLFFLL